MILVLDPQRKPHGSTPAMSHIDCKILSKKHSPLLPVKSFTYRVHRNSGSNNSARTFSGYKRFGLVDTGQIRYDGHAGRIPEHRRPQQTFLP
jgi:hypothetical protein